MIDECVARFKETDIDYFSNIDPPTYPDGLDIEVCKYTALELASYETNNPYDREHVTSYLRESGKFKTSSIKMIKIYLAYVGQLMN